MRRFPPSRIVCLTEETVETLYLLGEQERIVGVSGYTVRPPEARRDKPRVSAFTSADIPKILALEPDLVFTFSDLQAEIASELIRAGVAVHAFNQRDIAGILAMIRTVGALVGAADRADALARGYETRLAEARTEARGRPRPKVFFEEWNDPADQRHRLGVGADRGGRRRGRVRFAACAEIRQGPDRSAGGGDRRVARPDPRLVVRQEGSARTDPRPPRLGRHPRGQDRADRRDQVAADSSARSGRADGWFRRAQSRHRDLSSWVTSASGFENRILAAREGRG